MVLESDRKHGVLDTQSPKPHGRRGFSGGDHGDLDFQDHICLLFVETCDVLEITSESVSFGLLPSKDPTLTWGNTARPRRHASTRVVPSTLGVLPFLSSGGVTPKRMPSTSCDKSSAPSPIAIGTACATEWLRPR